jgi:hypothetical protein
MKKITLILIGILVVVGGCSKYEIQEIKPIDFGVKSVSTSIKSINQTGNIVTVVFETTVGAKYSVQITPFGSETPVKKEGFTATESTTQKVYDLSNLSKKDYDLTFMDIYGKEVKYPIVIK